MSTAGKSFRAQGGLRPRQYEPVAHAFGDDRCGMILHRDVGAIRVPGGFVVQVYEYVTDPNAVAIATGPGPGHYTTIFLPVETLDEVVQAFFVEEPS